MVTACLCIGIWIFTFIMISPLTFSLTIGPYLQIRNIRIQCKNRKMRWSFLPAPKWIHSIWYYHPSCWILPSLHSHHRQLYLYWYKSWASEKEDRENSEYANSGWVAMNYSKKIRLWKLVSNIFQPSNFGLNHLNNQCSLTLNPICLKWVPPCHFLFIL